MKDDRMKGQERLDDGRQRSERREKGTCRDLGRRDKTQPVSGNEREESK